MVLTEAWSFGIFSPKGSGGNEESGEGGAEVSDEGMGAERPLLYHVRDVFLFFVSFFYLSPN